MRPEGLSIVIPNWNHRTYLARSVGSALRALRCLEAEQVPGEVVVIDDGSRDGSQKLLRSLELWQADRLRALFLPENRGPAAARNEGLEASEYRYVLFLDADNELIPENVGVLVRAIRETGATFAYGNLIDRRGRDVLGLRSNDVASMRLTRANYIDALAVVNAERVLELGGYMWTADFRGIEDWELVLHLIAEEEEIVFVPVALAYYHVLPAAVKGAEMSVQPDVVLRRWFASMRRVFAESGTREWDPATVGRVYHPDLGFVDPSWQ